MLGLHRRIVGFAVLGLLAVACSSGSSTRKSDVGQSCQTTDDCTGTSVCADSICQKPGWQPRLSQIGESCQVSADCQGTAACESGTCRAVSFGIKPNKKECVLIECSVPTDCCPPAPALCPTWQQTCAQDATSAACTQYNGQCKCDGTAYDCTKNKCELKFPCKTSTDCTLAAAQGAGPVCNNGLCVECSGDSDCTTVGTKCTANVCVPACTNDGECPLFSVCTSGTCATKGCTEDRECQAFDRWSTCNQSDHACHLTCTNDIECQNTTSGGLSPVVTANGNYSYQVCTSGMCQMAGCDTDIECHALLESHITASPSKHLNAVCQTP